MRAHTRTTVLTFTIIIILGVGLPKMEQPRRKRGVQGGIAQGPCERRPSPDMSPAVLFGKRLGAPPHDHSRRKPRGSCSGSLQTKLRLPNRAKPSQHLRSLALLSPTRPTPTAVGRSDTNCCGALQLLPVDAALAGAEHACPAAFQTVLRPLLRLLLLGQHVAPVRCTVERRHRFDSQQRGLRPRCRHWSTCRR
jgi:hypothetical protein